MELVIGDLFAGIGGFSHAFENVSGVRPESEVKFKTGFFCEIDPDAQKVLKKHWPHTLIHEDVKTIDGIAYNGLIDILCGGFPCQDVSVAGKKKGLFCEETIKELMFIYEKTREEIIRDHEREIRTRSGLWTEYKRLIKEIRPKWVVIENVRNLLNSGLATVIKDLHEIGYDCEWEVISAGSVGAPHLRERVWIVAYPRCGVATYSYSSTLRNDQQRPEAGWIGIQAEGEALAPNDGQERIAEIMVPHPYHFRFWPAFTSEETKLQWWAERTARFRNRWETEPEICRVDDGLSPELDTVDRNQLTTLRRTYEKERAQRIRQLGNSVVPPIIEIIAERILEIENERQKINY